ncbi:P-loop containing nucleoside triphosphate hydrolase protein [Hypoxylon sp. FL1857]|nr:P-loop containing nucleoside triphosphate hydrolase protein [Hypoxylon sp. FL1857]
MASTPSAAPAVDSDSSEAEYFEAATTEHKEANVSGPTDILYEVHWSHSRGTGMYESREDPYQDAEIYEPPREKPRCVISILIDAKGITTRGDDAGLPYHPPPAPGMRPMNMAQSRPLKRHPEDDFKTTSISIFAVKIHSLHLQQAIRGLVKYYPSQSLKGDVITVQKPYSMLLHYYHDLKKLRDMHSKKGNEDPTDEEIAHDLTVLIDWLEPHYINTIQQEEERHKRGVVTSESLWFLYKPGCNVYSQIGGNWRAFIVRGSNMVASLRPAMRPDLRMTNSSSMTSIIAWYLAHDGKRFVRRNKRFMLSPFDGERKITSLDLVPSQYINGADKVRVLLESRGHRYYDIMRNVPRHLGYSGGAISRSGLKRHYEGEIMVDPEAWKTQPMESDSDSGSDNKSALSDEANTDSDEDADGGSNVGQSSREDAYDSVADWRRLRGSQAKDPASAELSPHQKSLLATRLRGFALRHKSWMLFELDNTHDIVREERDLALKNLIIPEEDRRILTAVTRKHIGSKPSPLFTDFIHGKGEGLILLLHGKSSIHYSPLRLAYPNLHRPTGHRKDIYQCIAEYTRRPLLSLTVADIGTKEELMETRLSDWFSLATKWEAVLLIDEADVFLEKRGLSDLARNSLVSVFLRTMEYYNGMLFLTTNRVGHLDDSFLSRIQVAITYKKLDIESQKKIWLRFFDKINDENQGLTVSWEAQHYIASEEAVKSMDMNGREIRNALQTAAALAQDRAVRGKGTQGAVVTADDIKQVASRRQRFTSYIDGIKKASEQERALWTGDRNDL